MVAPQPVPRPHVRMPSFTAGTDLRLFVDQMEIYFDMARIDQVVDRFNNLALALPAAEFGTLTAVRQGNPIAQWPELKQSFLSASGCAQNSTADLHALKNRKQ